MPRALPYLLLLPATVFLCVFFLYPFILVAAESLTRGGAWTLENYQRMVTHWKFGVTFRNTLMLVAVVVPVQLAMALAMASMVIRESGFAEYYDPLTGEPLGGGSFTWTAAMVLEFLEGAGKG